MPVFQALSNLKNKKVGITTSRKSLVEIDLMSLVRSGRRFQRMTPARLPAFITDLRVSFAPIVRAPFFFHSDLQIPQRNLGTIPAAGLIEDSSQMLIERLLTVLNLSRDLRIRESLGNKCRDRPLLTGEIRIPMQQRHRPQLHFKLGKCQECKTALLDDTVQLEVSANFMG